MSEWRPIEGDEIKRRGLSKTGVDVLFEMLVEGCERKKAEMELELKWLKAEPMTPEEIMEFAQHLRNNPERCAFLNEARMPKSAEGADHA